MVSLYIADWPSLLQHQRDVSPMPRQLMISNIPGEGTYIQDSWDNPGKRAPGMPLCG